MGLSCNKEDLHYTLRAFSNWKDSDALEKASWGICKVFSAGWGFKLALTPSTLGR